MSNDLEALARKYGGTIAPIPIEDPGISESMLIGTGRMLDKGAKGLEQYYYQLTGNQPELARMKAQEQGNDEQYAKLAKMHPIATGIGEAAPMMMVPAAGGIRAAMAASAIPGLVSYGTPQEKALNAVLGAAGAGVGVGVGKAVGAALSKPEVSASQQLARDAAERLGVQLRPGELANSRVLRWGEAALNDLPISGNMAQRAEAVRTKAINSAGARAMGQVADDITPSVFAAARQETGAEFNRILSPLKDELDNTFRQDVKMITGSKVLRELRDESVDALLDQFKNMPAGKIKVSGEWFQQNKTALDNAIRAAYDGKMAGKARALEQFENALDAAAKRSMSADDRAAFEAAQKQWASMRLLETGNVVEAGKVNAGRLKEALRSRYKNNYKEGNITGELADIATLAEHFKPMPQSGTAPRAAYSALASGAAFVEPTTALAAFAVPTAAQYAMQSPMARRIAAQGVADISPSTRYLLGYGGGLAGLIGADAVRP